MVNLQRLDQLISRIRHMASQRNHLGRHSSNPRTIDWMPDSSPLLKQPQPPAGFPQQQSEWGLKVLFTQCEESFRLMGCEVVRAARLVEAPKKSGTGVACPWLVSAMSITFLVDSDLSAGASPICSGVLSLLRPGLAIRSRQHPLRIRAGSPSKCVRSRRCVWIAERVLGPCRRRVLPASVVSTGTSDRRL